ncbi:GNAT family N-acetyltransferase [Pseudomonas chlororaphis]|uniref:GNAT family N-acetyltransferase n=1 Tax=Pseudomonas chlororaphis TaxID=587753 RepID=UPI0003D31950|nr:GNAT family N-acetyltransferase [Pseudomonas chlororaphis]AZD30238.1 Acetyltransferase, including N-acetylases of ribosomal protein [Pseudomonas chlororaphis]ETD39602.1 acetyltransferase [Pseudomonas chlororaphis subsp. aurantiaca PB-St2]QFS55642.1 GNAT family N-acetyltransferase [Pseudomonas chlororaphis subsp. aurantiaca]
MPSFKVRELRREDTEALLAFETRNREWFESHIEARDSAFYSVQGVAEHIEGYLAGFAAGTWHPWVIEDCSATIIGRANLKNIDSAQGSAEVGYRIAQSACGQGLATQALRHLIQQARTRWHLRQLVAYVYKENLGSTKVVERCGFLPEPSAEDGKAGDERRFVLPI